MKARSKIIILLIILWFPHYYMAVYAQENYAGTSLLATGQWFRIAVRDNGIYRIDYSRLRQMGLTDPSSPRIYGNNQGQMSYFNDNSATDDLREIPVMFFKGLDGIFNEGDYILFYAMGPQRWKYDPVSHDYNFIRHNYSDSSYYFITSSSAPGKEVASGNVVSDTPTGTSAAYDALYIHEAESENLIKSGREWYQPISSISPIDIDPGFSNVVTSEKVRYTIRVLARSSSPTSFGFYEGTNNIENISVPEVNMLSTTGLYAADVLVSDSLPPASSTPAYEIRFNNNGESGAKGWIDYIKLQVRATLNFSGKTTEFSDSRSVGPGSITEFSIIRQNSAMNIWDVTDPYNPQTVETYQISGNNYGFKVKSDSLRKFIAFSADMALTPTFRTNEVPNQNLHGTPAADMVIVAHPLFLKYAEKLKDIHYSNSGLISLIVTPEQIYNEFSGGTPDIAAIRNFLRMKYLRQKGTSHPLKYLLIFGDGSYENKTLPPKNPNFVPTYQSQNSTVVVSSFTSDDFYGLLDDGEGEADGTEDLGIGRFPVADTVQASILVSKVSRYLGEESIGNWRNLITITADDEDGNTHMMDAEGLYALLNAAYPDLNIDKIYLDAFRQVTTVNGQSYPDVEKAINDRINSGCLIFNYLGHGNEIGLAHERVVKTEDINSWRNGSKLPLFITATCEFSRFDDIEISPINNDMTGKTSAGEMVILNRDGGGIALMTTTRVVYSAPNYTLNRNILYYAFARDTDGSAYRLGDVIRLAKLNSGNGMNKRNFLLLGDPAVRLDYPWHGNVITDSINGVSVLQPHDSVKALSLIKISGHLADNNGSLMSDFNGLVTPTVFDKTRKVKTLANDGGQVMEFDLRNNILFSGKTQAESGRFSFSFIVPRDIDYSFGNGKISYYANKGTTDLGGSYSEIVVGGFGNGTNNDFTGPLIKLYLNDTLFRDGGMCDNNPLLLAVIEDSGGINTTGSGIGHDLTAFIDDDRNGSFLLNNFFENDLNNYMKGSVTYPLTDLAGGQHSITLKAWDNYNNSSQAELKFVVKTNEGFIINNLLNFPNPFTDQTRITAEHNRPDEDLKVRINIYDMSGRAIKIIETTMPSTGYRLQPVIWDGTGNGGQRCGRGVYPYTVTITTSGGETAGASGRMIIL